MDYEKAYKEALEKAKQFHNKELYAECNGNLVEYIFPELAESKDEKIRKEMLNVFMQLDECTTICGRNYDYAKWIAWLEKQKDHEAELDKAYKTADEVMYRRGYEDAKRELEMQGEKKSDICEGCNNVKGCVTCTNGDQWAHITEASTVELSDDENPTYKKPKFKAGDWITNEKGYVWQIDEVKTKDYLLRDSENILFAEEIEKIDSEFHLCTI